MQFLSLARIIKIYPKYQNSAKIIYKYTIFSYIIEIAISDICKISRWKKI